MAKKGTVTAVVNQKGGTGKTTTCENLGIGLAMEGKKVLLVDTDRRHLLQSASDIPCRIVFPHSVGSDEEDCLRSAD